MHFVIASSFATDWKNKFAMILTDYNNRQLCGRELNG